MTNNPQLENGYLKLATGCKDNDIVRALVRAGLNGAEWDTVMIVIRKTWGFKKPSDQISLSQFAKMGTKTRLSYINAIKSLVKKNILVKKTILGSNEYSFNKRFDGWVVKKTILVKKTIPKVVKKTIPTKEKSLKENIYTREFEQFVEYYEAKLGVNIKRTQGRKAKFKTRRKTFSMDDIMRATKNILEDNFLQGDNKAGKKYGNVDYILRSDEQIDNWCSNHKVKIPKDLNDIKREKGESKEQYRKRAEKIAIKQMSL